MKRSPAFAKLDLFATSGRPAKMPKTLKLVEWQTVASTISHQLLIATATALRLQAAATSDASNISARVSHSLTEARQHYLTLLELRRNEWRAVLEQALSEVAHELCNLARQRSCTRVAQQAFSAAVSEDSKAVESNIVASVLKTAPTSAAINPTSFQTLLELQQLAGTIAGQQQAGAGDCKLHSTTSASTTAPAVDQQNQNLPPRRLRIFANTSVTEFEPTQRTVLVGRSAHSDIQISDAQVSRCHLVVLTLQELGKRLIIDIGSANGCRVLARGATQTIAASTPGNRAVFVFETSETVVLELVPGRQIVLQPTPCLACSKAPCTVPFHACGHFVVCALCVNKLSMCPLCKTSRVGANVRKSD